MFSETGIFNGRMFLKRGMSDSTITDDPGRQAMCWGGADVQFVLRKTHSPQLLGPGLITPGNKNWGVFQALRTNGKGQGPHSKGQG